MGNNKGIQNLKHFKKGQSGNPKGRKKGIKDNKTLLREMLALEVTTHEGKKISNQQLMLMRLLKKAIEEGDIRAIREIFDRTEGKAAATVELSNKEGESFKVEQSLSKEQIDAIVQAATD